MLTFLHAATAGEPLWICEDLRRHIYALSKERRCQRCRRVVSTGRSTDRVHMCVTQGGTFCFTCWHAVRWPKG